MTHLTPPPPGPFGSDTDEALNALVDGELGAFASDHGLSEDQVRAELDAWPGYAAALAALTDVHAAVAAASVPPLDDLTRRRLVKTAVNAVPGSASSPAKPRRNWAAITAAAAAALIVVAGIGFAISQTSTGTTSADRASGGSAATAAGPLEGSVGDLGDVTDPAALRALLARGTTSTTTAAGGAGAADSSSSAESPQADLAPPSANSEQSVKRSSEADAVTPEECAQQLAGDRKVTFFGTGTYQGAPVTIVGLPSDGRTIVFVVSSTDCTEVVASISR